MPRLLPNDVLGSRRVVPRATTKVIKTPSEAISGLIVGACTTTSIEIGAPEAMESGK